MGAMLPLGRTRVTADEYGQLVDQGQIVDHLESKGHSDPAEQVTNFIESVPDLLEWLEENGRDFPWRHTTNPWKIYVTEILLQRTRAGAVADIYDSFFSTFPSPNSVMVADDQTIFEEVRSLGFGNQRTRSIRDVARMCVEDHHGNVPEDLATLQEPWRVGPYSARACLLFAYNEPLALVDSNVARIFERVFDYEMPEQPHKSDGVYEFIEAFIPDDPDLARSLNYSFLDLGAMICTSKPHCSSCPLNTCCIFAHRNSSD